MTTTDRSQGNRNFNRRQRSKFFVRRRICQFCVDKVDSIDYKDIPLLQRYMSEGSKIDSRRKSGVCAKHQRALATAIKRARQIGMVPLDRTHRFVIKQTYQRGPAPRSNDDNVSSVHSSAGQGKTKETTTPSVAQSDEPAKAAVPDEENKASAQSDEPAKAAVSDEENKASAQSDEPAKAAVPDEENKASVQSDEPAEDTK